MKVLNNSKRWILGCIKAYNKDVAPEEQLAIPVFDGIAITPQQSKAYKLPDVMYSKREYTAQITEILKKSDKKYKKLPYTDWELRLKDKEEYVYIAFVPNTIQLQAGDNIKFIYEHPFRLKKIIKL